MSNIVLFNGVDVSIQQISQEVNLDKRAAWELVINSSGLDGTPQLFIEGNYSGSKCVDPVGDWVAVCNPYSSTNVFFPIDDSIITIEKNDFKRNWFRVRVEANDNTTGTISVTLSYKTYP